MTNRSPDLHWDVPDHASGTGLTRDRVVRAAIEIADSEGLDAVSIRRVAAALRARPMSLYTYIASKRDLVALMLDEVSGSLLVPEPLPSHWRDALRAIAYQAHGAYMAHPWILRVIGQGIRVGPNQLRRAEQSATAVSGLGIEPDDAWTALRIVHEWTIGHALHVIVIREDDQFEAQLRSASSDDFPRMTEILPSARGQPHDTNFDVAIDTVLDGIERRFLENRPPGNDGS